MVTRLKTVLSAIAIAAFTIAIAPPAQAQSGHASVELLGERGPLDPAKLDELVALELGPDASRVTRITIELRGPRATVDLMLGTERRTASVTLAPAEHERALALFVAELARGASSPAPAPAAPPAPPPVPAAPPTAPPTAPPSPPSAPPPARPWRLSALATIGARAMTTGGALLPTPKLEIGARQPDGLRLGATARYAFASADDPLGTVRAHAFAGGVAASYVLLSSATLALATGPRFEVGVIAGRGEGSNGESATALTLGGAWELELHVRLGGVSLLGSVEAGTLLQGVELHADDRDALHLTGPFVGFALGAML